MAEVSNGNGERDVVHYEPPRKSRGHGKVKIQAPLMPMIDVTFQLLLFFLVACQFRQDEGQIPGSLPDTSEGIRHKEVVKLRELKIVLRTVDFDEQTHLPVAAYFVGGDKVGIHNPETLFTRLRAHQESLGGSKLIPVIIEPRGNVPWQYVLEAYNQTVRAKFKSIGFAIRN